MIFGAASHTMITSYSICVTTGDAPIIAADIANNITEKEKSVAGCISLQYVISNIL